MWKDSIRNIVVIFQPNILRIVGVYVRRLASDVIYGRPDVQQIIVMPLE